MSDGFKCSLGADIAPRLQTFITDEFLSPLEEAKAYCLGLGKAQNKEPDCADAVKAKRAVAEEQVRDLRSAFGQPDIPLRALTLFSELSSAHANNLTNTLDACIDDPECTLSEALDLRKTSQVSDLYARGAALREQECREMSELISNNERCELTDQGREVFFASLRAEAHGDRVRNEVCADPAASLLEDRCDFASSWQRKLNLVEIEGLSIQLSAGIDTKATLANLRDHATAAIEPEMVRAAGSEQASDLKGLLQSTALVRLHKSVVQLATLILDECALIPPAATMPVPTQEAPRPSRTPIPGVTDI